MFDKPWQRQNLPILYTRLAVAVAATRISLDFPFAWWEKLLIIVGSYALVFFVGGYLHRKYANVFVKVFEAEYDVASRVVQRALNAQRIPFTKRTYNNQVDFFIRTGEFKLVVENFPLNLPVDEHIKPVIGSKITMSPVNRKNGVVAASLRDRLDEILVPTIA